MPPHLEEEEEKRNVIFYPLENGNHKIHACSSYLFFSSHFPLIQYTLLLGKAVTKGPLNYEAEQIVADDVSYSSSHQRALGSNHNQIRND